MPHKPIRPLPDEEENLDRLMDLDPLEFLVIQEVFDCRGHTEEVNTISTIAGETGLSYRKVRAALHSLKRRGLVYYSFCVSLGYDGLLHGSGYMLTPRGSMLAQQARNASA